MTGASHWETRIAIKWFYGRQPRRRGEEKGATLGRIRVGVSWPVALATYVAPGRGGVAPCCGRHAPDGCGYELVSPAEERGGDVVVGCGGGFP